MDTIHRLFAYTGRLALAAACSALPVERAAAQGPVASPSFAGPAARADVSTGEGAAVAAGVAVLFLVDRPIHRFLQAHRSRSLDHLAAIFRTMGTAPVYGGIAVGVLGGGLIANDPEVKRAGGRLILSEVATIAADELIKRLTGRARPDAAEGPFDFDPFHNKQVSFVSGHSAMAFVLATSLADDVHNTWASIGLYTFAAGTAWSRLNDDRHWPSDVVGGAVLGMTVSRMVSNRWEILDFNPPRFLTEHPAPAD